MGKRGIKPKTKPTLQSVRVDSLECPDRIGPAGREIFDWACHELAAQGRLTSDCLAALEGLAGAYQIVRECDPEIKALGLVVSNDRGGYTRNPAVMVRVQYSAECERWLKQLMLTPASRSGVVVDPNAVQGEDAFERFMRNFGEKAAAN